MSACRAIGSVDGEREQVGPVIVARDVEGHLLFAHAIEVGIEDRRMVEDPPGEARAVRANDRASAAVPPSIPDVIAASSACFDEYRSRCVSSVPPSCASNDLPAVTRAGLEPATYGSKVANVSLWSCVICHIRR